MEFDRSTVNSAKTILRLEVKCNQLQQENINLKEDLMEAKGKEKEMEEKYLKKKDKYGRLKEKFYLEERKWSEEEEKIMEKCWQLEGEKKKLEIDLKVAEKLKSAEALKRLFEEQDGTITNLLTKNESLEQHISMLLKDFEIKMAMEAEKHKVEEEKILVLTRKIQVLDGEKRELEAEVCRARTEMSEVINTISNEKSDLKEMSLEEISNLVSRASVLEREKHILEAEAREKDERIKVLVQDKEHMVEEISNLVSKTSVLEREKHILEAETREKDERIKLLVEDKEHVVGPKFVDVSVAESKQSSDGNLPLRGMLGSEIQNRKVAGLRCFDANQDGPKRCKLDDMFNAFTINDELCMRSVCALYRKYKSLGEWKNRLISSNNGGFMQPYETRGMALGELLTSGDPEGRLKMSLAEFEQADPCGLEDCRFIAWEHEKEFFEMYMNNLDPLFMPSDDMNCFFSSR